MLASTALACAATSSRSAIVSSSAMARSSTMTATTHRTSDRKEQAVSNPTFVDVVYGESVTVHQTELEGILAELIANAMSFNGVRVMQRDLAIRSTECRQARRSFDVAVHITTTQSDRQIENARVSPGHIHQKLLELYPNPELHFFVSVQPNIMGWAKN